MTEMAKTTVFVAVAIASLLFAFVVERSRDTDDIEELVGERLNTFDVDAAKRLRIVKFNKDTATAREFEVAEDDGLWTIPSKQGYPADATRQMAEAATCLINREILRIAATSAGEHATLGVVDPNSSKLEVGAKGVGIRVTMTDDNDEVLADMIIGKEVKDAEGQHYVRNANQDVVYVVEIDPAQLSTQFEDWIEDDLLKLSSFDIRLATIKDYSAEMRLALSAGGFVPQVVWDPRGEFDLRYESADSKWIAERLQEFDPEKRELVDFQLADDEELNQDTLREMRNGLQDLLIVDVERKPKGLSADLKAGEDFLQNQEANENLISRGFAPVALAEGGEQEILSSEGELICTLQDGVEYVLRFGNLKLDSDTSAATDSEGDDAADEETGADAGIHRYLFVMARLNEDMIEQPKLDDLPQLPEGAEEEKTTEESTADESAEVDETEGESTAEETEPEDATEASTDDANQQEESSDASEKNEDDELSKIIAERERIETENKRRLTEYQDKLKEAKDRVAELNERFGDWYYVIDNKVYKEIHLGRDQLIEKKEQPADEAESTDAATGLSGLPDLPTGDSAAAETQ